MRKECYLFQLHFHHDDDDQKRIENLFLPGIIIWDPLFQVWAISKTQELEGWTRWEAQQSVGACRH